MQDPSRAEPGPVVRVLIVEDHPSVRFALRTTLEDAGSTVIGEEETLGAALLRVRRDAPDVVLLDLGLPDAQGARGVRLIRAARGDQVVVVFTASEDAALLHECYEAGASAVVRKTDALEALAETVRRAAAGERLVDLGLSTAQGRGQGRGQGRRDGRELSKRELEVLAAVSQGRTNRQIATDLHVSEETVKTHLARAMAKLGASDRAQAVAIVLRRGSLP